MTDFCITAVKYNKDREHIEWVNVREEIPGTPRRLGVNRVVHRAFVADLIRLKKATFQTRVKNSEGNWAVGAPVHVIDDTFLATKSNNTKKDNLENLDEFN